MKVIGNAKEDGSGNGGIIIQLNYREADILAKLQSAIEGEVWSDYLSKRGNVKDLEIDKVFIAMYHFIVTKFAINELSEVIKRLDEVVNNQGAI